MVADDVKQALDSLASAEKAKSSSWFFKSGPGQYGEGDVFIGITVPQQRKIAKQFKDLPLGETIKLLHSPEHEYRLTALFILVNQFAKSDEADKKRIYDAYIQNTKWVNNWDLVDSSANYIVGPWLDNKTEKMPTLKKLAKSDILWERRIAMLSTFTYIAQGRADEALTVVNILLHDKHDLIQKAVGWMLREIGKRVDRKILLDFLDKHRKTMPRTTLRYAIEHLPPEQRAIYMSR